MIISDSDKATDNVRYLSDAAASLNYLLINGCIIAALVVALVRAAASRNTRTSLSQLSRLVTANRKFGREDARR